MDIFFLGIGGTLMGHLALLAHERGHAVRGSDTALYPPMSDVLEAAGIPLYEGWEASYLTPRPDLVVLGNAGLPRGHPAVEQVLNEGLRYTSGAEWLGQDVLRDRHVLAVAGTHGKTTTTAMLAWILEHAGYEPGYLVGGVPVNFEHSARLGRGRYFVVEADEYDTSYFDRRSKFVHYRPRTLAITGLEYDHADLFPDLAAIEEQFHLLMRTVPGRGRVVAPLGNDVIDRVLARGCWSELERVAAPGSPRPRRIPAGQETAAATLWRAAASENRTGHVDAADFAVQRDGAALGTVTWPLIGLHNVTNALTAIAAAAHVDIAPETAIEALCTFRGVRRRMELIIDTGNIRLYDDFAHHPSAIRSTLQGLREVVGNEEILALVDPHSHTMSLGSLYEELRTCCVAADHVWWLGHDKLRWDIHELAQKSPVPSQVAPDAERLASSVLRYLQREGRGRRHHVVMMSNASFGGVRQQLAEALAVRPDAS